MAETTTMTVFEALQEVKLLEGKIEKAHRAIGPIIFAPAIKTKDEVEGGLKKDDVATSAKSWMDKYMSYTNRLNLLRGLIYESNLRTPMSVCGIEYTSVVAAIQRYKNIQREIDFWGSLQKTATDVTAKVARDNHRNLLPETIQKAINPNGVTYDPDQLKQMEVSYIESVELEVYDPLGLLKDNVLSDRVDEILEFKERFHTELNKVNLQTLIEIPVDEPKL